MLAVSRSDKSKNGRACGGSPRELRSELKRELEKELQKELKSEDITEHVLGGGGAMPCRGLLILQLVIFIPPLSRVRWLGGTELPGSLGHGDIGFPAGAEMP